jgi:hypothetical protein
MWRVINWCPSKLNQALIGPPLDTEPSWSRPGWHTRSSHRRMISTSPKKNGSSLIEFILSVIEPMSVDQRLFSWLLPKITIIQLKSSWIISLDTYLTITTQLYGVVYRLIAHISKIRLYSARSNVNSNAPLLFVIRLTSTSGNSHSSTLQGSLVIFCWWFFRIFWSLLTDIPDQLLIAIVVWAKLNCEVNRKIIRSKNFFIKNLLNTVS